MSRLSELSESSEKPSLKGLILAGGRGTRLRPLTFAMAKQLVPVANKPILHYALDALYEAGIREIGVIISPETGESIQASVLSWQPSDVRIEFILQDLPAGLAHAVKIAEPFLQDAPFLMYLGDNLINGSLRGQINDFLADQNAKASILLKQVPNPSSFGVAELDASGNAIRLVEKPKEPQSDLALVGVYLFRPEIFTAIANIQPSRRGELEITDAIQYLISSGSRVLTTVHTGWWLDTGKKDDLLAANQIVLQEFVQNHRSGHVSDNSQLFGPVDIGTDTEIINSVMTGPVRIGKNCRIENTTLGPYTSIGDGCSVLNCHIENSVFLENCQLSNIPGRIDDSLTGQGCRIAGSPAAEQRHKFLLADLSEIQVV